MADRLGQQLGKYRLTRLLGTGGFAKVYLGEHIHLGTQAAIKLLHAQLSTPADVEKFRREARTIAGLVYPSIVRVLDFEVEGGTPYLVMDYAPNGSLRQTLPAGVPLPPASMAGYVVQAAEALQYAHDQKLIHRDIKPENMLLGRRGELLLSDFGIATVAQSTSQQKTEGVAGTTAYMSPEQLQGKPRPSSDLYSLAVVIYEWLCGERPFQGSFVEIATQHLFTPPPPLRERVPTLSPAVEHVVLTALAKDPRDRFGSVRAFANAFLQASGVDAPFASLRTRLVPGGSQPSARPASAAGILVSADSQLTPRVTPELSKPLPANTPPPSPVAPRGPQAGPAEPSIFSAPTQLAPASSGPQPQGSLPVQSVFSAETVLTPPTAGNLPSPGGSGPHLAETSSQTCPDTTLGKMPTGRVLTAPPAVRRLGKAETVQADPPPVGMPAGFAPVPNVPPSAVSAGGRGRRPALFIPSVVLVLVLLGVGSAYAVLGGLIHFGSSATTVTITPRSSDLKQTFNLTGVIGTPDASQMQISERTVSVTTRGQSKTVPATGQGTIPGTHARAIMEVSNGDTAHALSLTESRAGKPR